MHSVIYSKLTKKIVFAKNVAPINGGNLTPLEELQIHCDVNNLDINDYVAVDYSHNRRIELVLGNHMFDEATGTIVEDPNYVPPVPVAPPQE